MQVLWAIRDTIRRTSARKFVHHKPLTTALTQGIRSVALDGVRCVRRVEVQSRVTTGRFMLAFLRKSPLPTSHDRSSYN